MGLFKTIGSVAKSALGVIMPTAASLLPGPLGGIAKKVVTDALGLESDSSNEQIEQALATQDPAALERLRQIDANFKLGMEKAKIDLEAVYAGDRASARDREIKLKDNAPKILAAVTITGWLALTFFLYRWTPPEANHDLLMVSFGILSTAVVGIFNYYFGSSAGSARKTEIMNGGKK